MPQTFNQISYMNVLRSPEDLFHLHFNNNNKTNGNVRKRSAQIEQYSPMTDENGSWCKRLRFDEIKENPELTEDLTAGDCPMESMDADIDDLNVSGVSETSQLPMNIIDVNAIVEPEPQDPPQATKINSTENAAPTGCSYFVSSNCAMRDAAHTIKPNIRGSHSETRHHQRQWGYMDHYFSAGHWF